MRTVLWIGFGVIAAGSALAVALGRESRASVLAWWINGISASLLLLGFDAELLAVVMALGVTGSAIALFLHADAFGEPPANAVTGARRWDSGMILPALASIGAGVLVVALLRAVIGGTIEMAGTPARGATFEAEEGFIPVQIVALAAFAAVIGAAVISRPARPGEASGERRDLHD